MADVRAAQGRIEHRLELQGVLIDQTRRELARLTVHQDNKDERLGRVEGEVRALACRRVPQVGTESEGGYQTVASSPSVSQSPKLISADHPQGSTGMSVEVGSPTIPGLRYDANRLNRTRTRFSSQSLMGKGTFGRT